MVEENTQKEREEFIEYILRNDETSIILKGHLQLERSVDNLIKIVLKRSKIISRWSFLDKIEILYALGLIGESILNKFKMINTIRNKFAHNYAYRLSKDDISFFENFTEKAKPTDTSVPENLKKFPNIKEIILIT